MGDAVNEPGLGLGRGGHEVGEVRGEGLRLDERIPADSGRPADFFQRESVGLPESAGDQFSVSLKPVVGFWWISLEGKAG
jgi:hypothetical protein